MSHPPEGDAAVTPRRGSRHLHALLDSLFPGLGHLAAGRRRRAALFGLPTAAVVVLLLGGVLFASSSQLLGIALDPATVVIVFGLQLLLLVWRAAAVGSSLFDGRYPRLGARDALPMALLAVVLIVPQGFVAYGTEVAREEADKVIPIDPTTAGAWDPSASASAVPDPEVVLPSQPIASGSPEPSVPPSAAPEVPRQNVLIIGVDPGVGRNTLPDRHDDRRLARPGRPRRSRWSRSRATWSTCRCPTAGSSAARSTALVSYARHHPGSSRARTATASTC